MKNLIGLATLTGTLLACSPVFADFTLFDNFDSYTTGAALSGQGPAGNTWSVGQPTFSSIVSVSSSFANSAVFNPSISSGVVNAYRSLTPSGLGIVNASTSATVFWQFQITATIGNNWNFALNDVAAPTGNSGDNEIQFNFDSGSATTFRARNAANFKSLSTTGAADGNIPLLANSTYSVWFVVNNSADTYEVYMQNNDILALNGTAHQVLANDGTGGSFTFRNGAAANDLTTVNMGPGGNTLTNAAFIDNLFVDLSGKNLTTPSTVPEPTTGLLLLSGSLTLLALRRFRSQK